MFGLCVDWMHVNRDSVNKFGNVRLCFIYDCCFFDRRHFDRRHFDLCCQNCRHFDRRHFYRRHFDRIPIIYKCINYIHCKSMVFIHFDPYNTDKIHSTLLENACLLLIPSYVHMHVRLANMLVDATLHVAVNCNKDY